MAKKILKVRWSSASATAAADWFSSDVSVGGAGPVKHILQCSFASVASVVNLVMTRDSVVKTIALNGGAVVSLDSLFQEAFIVIPGTAYNVQHATGQQQISGIIMVDEDDLNIS